MRTFDIAVIVLYLIALTGIGLRFSKRQTTTETYFVANRSIPGWAVGLSLLATIITSISFIAYPGAAYGKDWSLLTPGLMFLVVLPLVSLVLVPFFRHAVHMTAFEYFGARFGRPVRLYSSFAFALVHFSKMGFVFYLVALTLSGITGFSIVKVIAITGVVTVFYTLIGGVEAVVWSDVIQGFVLWLGIVISIGFIVFLPHQGPAAVFSDAWTHHKMSLGPMQWSFSKQTLPLLCLYGFFTYFQKYVADQTIVQRYLLAKTDRSAVRGITLGVSLCIPVWTLFMLIGSLLWSFYRLTGEKLPPGIKADQVFPHFLVTHIPVGLCGLFIAAMLGAAMSMLASDMNCLAMVGVEDFYRAARPRATDRQALRMGRFLVAASGLAAAGLGLYLSHNQGGALQLYYAVVSIVSGGLVGLFFLAFVIPRATPRGAIAGIVMSLLFTVWATLTLGGKTLNLGRWNFPWHEYMIGVLSHVVLFGVGVVVSLLDGRSAVMFPSGTLQGWRLRRGQERALRVSDALEQEGTHKTSSQEGSA